MNSCERASIRRVFYDINMFILMDFSKFFVFKDGKYISFNIKKFLKNHFSKFSKDDPAMREFMSVIWPEDATESDMKQYMSYFFQNFTGPIETRKRGLKKQLQDAIEFQNDM